MNTRRTKVLALLALASVWVGLLLWQWFAWKEPVRLPLANVSGSVASSANAGIMDNLHVQLDLLAAARTQREMVFATPRNIFALPAAVTVNASRTVDVPDDALRQQAVATGLAQYHY